jgi:L-cysteine S-thiosulfotransferase
MVRQYYDRYVWLTTLLIGLTMPLPSIAVDAGYVGIDDPLTGQPGDSLRGEAIAADDRKGNCIICHMMPVSRIPAGAFGDIGPPLQGVGSRLKAAQLRQRIVDPRVLSPDTIMPAYFVKDGLTRVQPAYSGKTILTPQDVEDLVAYLASLK